MHPGKAARCQFKDLLLCDRSALINKCIYISGRKTELCLLLKPLDPLVIFLGIQVVSDQFHTVIERLDQYVDIFLLNLQDVHNIIQV